LKTIQEEIASEVIDELFTNSFGDEAVRLRFELAEKRDGGGWCKDAAIDIASEAIKNSDPFQKLRKATQSLVDDLKEAHADEIESDHNGDGPGCSYCRDIGIAEALLTTFK
jgi:hypothetical protein